jgi:siroheme synthase (precorrin-2 oxidase/ferrochelatase)
MHVPVNLDVAGRLVLVVGSGAVAERRAVALADAGADVTRVDAAGYLPGDAARYWLVLTDAGPDVNQAVFEDAEAAGVWCNAADDPQHCSFLVPAIVRRGPVTVAVSTGGASPALASWLRREIEAAIGPEFAEVALRLAEERRRIHGAGGSTEDVDWTSRIEAHVARSRAGHALS